MKYIKDGVEIEMLDEYFVETALIDAWEHDDLTKLKLAIEHGLPQLLFNPYPNNPKFKLDTETRRMILSNLLQIRKGRVGKSPRAAKRKAERDSQIWLRINFYRGTGLPVESKLRHDAFEAVAKDFNVSRDTVRDVWKRRGGRKEAGWGGAKFQFYKGKAEAALKAKPNRVNK